MGRLLFTGKSGLGDLTALRLRSSFHLLAPGVRRATRTQDNMKLSEVCESREGSAGSEQQSGKLG